MNTCYNGGKCVASLNDANTQVTTTCQCQSAQYSLGSSCEYYNPCASSPCMNNGKCTAFVNGTAVYSCTCPINYSGERCQFSLTQIGCESVNIPNNCRNGGTCMLIGMSTTCICTSAYTGSLCESPINMCSIITCQNGGTCLPGNGTDFRCQCLPSFQGTYCEHSTDPCSLQPCLNGGQCIPSASSSSSSATFICNCAQTHYTGARCETLISLPCVINPVRKFTILALLSLNYLSVFIRNSA